VRRLDLAGCARVEDRETFAGTLALKLGSPHPARGLIDWGLGDPIRFVPFTRVLEWLDAGEHSRLERLFRDRPVLLGLVRSVDDRYRIPVELTSWQPEARRVPAIVVQAQALRTLMAGGPIRSIDRTAIAALVAVACLFWFGRRTGWKLAGVATAGIGLAAFGTWTLAGGVFIPVGGIIGAAALALGARTLFDAIAWRREKQLLKRAFAGSVAPRVMRRMMRGALEVPLAGRTAHATILIADLQGFGRLAASTTPREAFALLDRHFDAMVAAVLAREGTLDKFMGDAVMAIFGAPQPLACPEKNALEAAQAMLVALEAFNRARARDGLAPLDLRIGIDAGECLVGCIGARSRQDYTALGAPVARALRIQALARAMPHPVVVSRAIADAVGRAGGLADLGEHVLEEHGRAHLFGWTPPILADGADAKPSSGAQARAPAAANAQDGRP